MNLHFCRCLYFSLLLLISLGSCSPDKKTLFTKLDASKTGIQFVNENVDTDTLSIIDYLYYYNGAGVSVGDINNDDLPDIYFASNTKGSKLFLNKGNFRFEDITTKAGVAALTDWTTGVTMADVNGDGFVSPIDVLQLVNYLNFNGGGRLPFPVAFAIPPYLDVDGDGSVGPLDVLTVINYINSPSTGGGAEGEGFGANDWISASSLAAPGIESGHKQEASSQSSSQQSIATSKIQSLDQYLARVASDMGPSLAVDDLDWSATLPALEEVKNKDRDFAVALAIDDLLSDWE